jgi:hypothetical protein
MELGAYLALFGFGGNAALCGNGNVPDSCGWGRIGQLVGRCSVVRRKPLLVDVVVGEAWVWLLRPRKWRGRLGVLGMGVGRAGRGLLNRA